MVVGKINWNFTKSIIIDLMINDTDIPLLLEESFSKYIQSILDFKKLFKASVSLLRQIEAGTPDDETQAVIYIK